MHDERERPSPELLERIRAIGAECILAGCTIEETLEAINTGIAGSGFQYRARPVPMGKTR